MFRNQYDQVSDRVLPTQRPYYYKNSPLLTKTSQDMLTWSPQGRLHQVEYAVEAVKQGSTVVACGVRSFSKDSIEKIFTVNERVGVAVSGLSTDCASLVKLLRQESTREEFVFDRLASPDKLAATVSRSSQISMRKSSGRPWGVGVVLVGVSENSVCQILQTCPSGNIQHVVCTAVGARSQSARTYLEKQLQALQYASVEETIKIALQALSESNVEPGQLTAEMCELATVEANVFSIKSPEQTGAIIERFSIS